MKFSFIDVLKHSTLLTTEHNVSLVSLHEHRCFTKVKPKLYLIYLISGKIQEEWF